MHQSPPRPSSPSQSSSPPPVRGRRTSGVVKKIKKPYLYVKAHLAPKHPTETTPPRASSGRGLFKRLSMSQPHTHSPSESDTSTSPPPSPSPPSRRRTRTTSLHSLIHHISFHTRSSSHTMAEPKSRDLTESPPESLAHGTSSLESERPESVDEQSSIQSSIAEDATPIARTAAQFSEPPAEASASHQGDVQAAEVTPIAPAVEEFALPADEAPSHQDDGQVSAPVEFGESATREDILAPLAQTEPEVPDPFLVDDPDSPITESEPPTARLPPQVEASMSALQVGAAEDISLSLQTPVGSSEALAVEEKQEEPAPPVPNKPVVAPSSVSDSSESEAPAIYLPQLILPAMFLPIPNTDPLTTLLMKYIPNPEQRPRRDVTGEWARTDFHTLVMTNSWRALARMARDRLVQSDPEDLDAVLNLWSLRLSALARLRLFNQTAAETTNLFTALHSVPDASARAHLFAHVLPFELEVLHARVKYWAGDARGYVDALGALLGTCRVRARRARSDGDRQMWMERGARVGLIVASQFVEMKDYIAATRLLEPLLAQPAATPDLRSAIARIYLQAGQLDAAAAHFAAVAAAPDASALTKEMNVVLLATARGEWDDVSAALRRIVDSDPENFTAVNNLSVALLSQGKLKEATEVLEAAFQASPSTLAMAEPFLFNLSTLYELRSGVAVDKKRDLLVQVAQWSGDGLRTTCLKMPSS